MADMNIFGETSYFTVEKFNEFNSTIDYKKNISIMHLNCRSLAKNFDNLSFYLSDFKQQFSVIALSETWLKKSHPNLYHLDNYSFVGQERENKRGGGVGFYILDTLKYKIKDDLYISDEYCEAIFVEINETVIIGCIYRPPGQSADNFLCILQNTLHLIPNNMSCYLVGDYNINLLSDGSLVNNDFTDMYSSFSFYPLVNKPTRITAHSSTLIDNIFANKLEMVRECGILFGDVSDHLPIFCIASLSYLSSYSGHLNVVKRVINDSNIFQFCRVLKDFDWDLRESNVNDMFNGFLDVFLELYNNCFPFCNLKSTPSCKNKAWFTKDLKKMCKKRQSLYKKFILNRTPTNERNYKIFRNKCTKAIRKTKQQYFHSKFSSVKGNSKATWKEINFVLNRKRNFNTPSKVLNNDNIITNTKDIAHEFNKFFISIGPNLQKKTTGHL